MPPTQSTHPPDTPADITPATTTAATAAPASATPTSGQHVWDGKERRSAHRQWQDRVERRLSDGDEAMKALRSDLSANTAATSRVEASTAELVGILNSAKGAFSVLEWLGKLAKPMGAIAALAASVVALWSGLKGGGFK